ncbi:MULTISPECIES: prephenate dehydratase [unclassified Clostridium]|uniref:prephenate dehydratase n=1 Tax=Clostridium TaxID=1485 RepID=UPI001C8CE419|nr:MULTISPECIES: prephenate dehydratase [unclassified Clostridium]MBX9138561.1 prephenate dehydratase [Clostridium sp. K12(2020)]MBX9144902.1 prephenate dehydratase [Clostridium sp. K13]MDU2291804.1 prephenate dehydratase [Clostridium celatum]MDU4326592.1 prephenate dehydratase [Clostridium celatum]
MDLSECRKEIDKIDKELVELFERRMNVAIKVAEYKIENNLPILNEAREAEVIEKNINRLNNKEYSKLTEKFFTNLMELSRSLQGNMFNSNEDNNRELIEENISNNENKRDLENIKIGYQGVKGSFSEEAMIKYFGENHTTTDYEEFEDVFLALKNNKIDYGILPIENSCTGAITTVYDLLAKYGLYIVGEECIKIDQNLIGIKGTKLEDIKEVYSHPQGFEQSREFLSNYNNLKLIPFHNTAISAKYISEINDKSKAAIASLRAAEIYGLDVIKNEINDKDNNHTKFIIIGRKLESSNECNKITVVFSLDDKSGTLYNLLRHFAENNINMIKIESRPSKNEPWQYLLYVDFEGNVENDDVKKAIKLIEGKSEYFKLLGNYKKVSC